MVGFVGDCLYTGAWDRRAIPLTCFWTNEAMSRICGHLQILTCALREELKDFRYLFTSVKTLEIATESLWTKKQKSRACRPAVDHRRGRYRCRSYSCS